jgi:polyferredoxin
MSVNMTSSGTVVRSYHFRVASQIIFALVAVLGVFGIGMTGFIYPFFFCPASPGACAGCPLWVIEHGTIEIASGMMNGYRMIMYLIGMFLVIGTLVGRSFCGWACPVGTLQDLFSFIGRKVRNLKVLAVISGISFAALAAGAVIPSILADSGVELQSYMFLGYIGAMGAFILSLCGVLFIRIKKGVVSSILIIILGSLLWATVAVFRSLELENTPLASLELMGLMGMMFQTIGLVGIMLSALGDRKIGKRSERSFDRYGRLVKVALLVLIAPTSWFFDTLFFTDFDPIGGITATIPELLLNPSDWAGNQFFWFKAVFVVGVLVFVSFVDRGWCRYLCPIGAMYGPFNKIAVTDLEFSSERCVHCQKCIAVCPMGINPKENKTDPECIRCGRCEEACPVGAQVWKPVNSSIRGVFSR